MKNDDLKKKNAKKVEKKNVKKEEKKRVKEEVVLEKKNVKEEVVATKSNKKGDLFLIIGLALVVVLGFLVMGGKKEETYELPLTLSGVAGLHELNYEEVMKKLDGGEEFVLIVESANCPHCTAYMPVAEAFATDNNLPMYYVDISTFGNENGAKFEKAVSYLKKSNGKWGTPTTMVQAGNTTVDYIVGGATNDELLELYNKYFDMGE